MPPLPLPEQPSLDDLKEQATLVHELVDRGDEGAMAMLNEFHPLGSTEATAENFSYSDAQLVVARLYGFGGWPDLCQHLSVVEEFGHSDDGTTGDRAVDGGEDTDGELVDRLVVDACVTYRGVDPFAPIDRARHLLANNPDLPGRSVAALAVVGDHVGLGAALDASGLGVDEPVGPHRWPLLLYCVYSRIEPDEPSGRSTLQTTRLLLDRGADPNAGFLWRGLVPPFTALTGAFGRGERDQPPHPQALALARLLLEAGADPNDGQALYNNGLAGTAIDDPSHLELLFEFGLGSDTDGPWYSRLGHTLTPPARLLTDELEVAALRGFPDRMRFLIGLGSLDLDAPVGRSGQSAATLAARKGHLDILDLLADAGVAIEPTAVERTAGLVGTGSPAELLAAIDDQPNLLSMLKTERPGLVAEAAERGRGDMIPTLVELGFPVDGRAGDAGATGLHEASLAGDAELARILIDLGADPTITDYEFSATPCDWAEHFGRANVVSFFRSLDAGTGSSEAAPQ